MKALLLAAHGSRREQSNQEIEALGKRLQRIARPDFSLVGTGFLELGGQRDPGSALLPGRRSPRGHRRTGTGRARARPPPAGEDPHHASSRFLRVSTQPAAGVGQPRIALGCE